MLCEDPSTPLHFNGLQKIRCGSSVNLISILLTLGAWLKTLNLICRRFYAKIDHPECEIIYNTNITQDYFFL